jgi:hypothetical protein
VRSSVFEDVIRPECPGVRAAYQNACGAAWVMTNPRFGFVVGDAR